MTRILMLSEHASPIAHLGSTDAGGQNVYVDQLSRGLRRYSVEVDVYTRADAPGQPTVVFREGGGRVIHVPAGPPAPIPKDQIWPHIGEFLAATEDLAACYGPYDLIHANFWMSGWVGVQLRERWGIPLVQIFHALGAVKRQHQGEADTSPAHRVEIERQVVRATDRIIAQCPHEVEELVGLYGANPERVRVIPSGVDVSHFFPIPRRLARQALGLPLDERIIVYVGRMLPRKDVENVIRALALLGRQTARTMAPVRLIAVGGETEEGCLDQEPEIRRLTAIAEDLGVRDRVSFVGRRPSERLRWYYSAADVFVSTPWYEPYGLTPLEAMACGTPAVCSAVGGITFTVVDGETGFLVPPRQPAALADRLALILFDDILRRRLARNTRKRVEELFTWATVAERTAELYQDVLSGAAAWRRPPDRNH